MQEEERKSGQVFHARNLTKEQSYSQQSPSTHEIEFFVVGILSHYFPPLYIYFWLKHLRQKSFSFNIGFLLPWIGSCLLLLWYYFERVNIKFGENYGDSFYLTILAQLLCVVMSCWVYSKERAYFASDIDDADQKYFEEKIIPKNLVNPRNLNHHQVIQKRDRVTKGRAILMWTLISVLMSLFHVDQFWRSQVIPPAWKLPATLLIFLFTQRIFFVGWEQVHLLYSLVKCLENFTKDTQDDRMSHFKTNDSIKIWLRRRNIARGRESSSIGTIQFVSGTLFMLFSALLFFLIPRITHEKGLGEVAIRVAVDFGFIALALLVIFSLCMKYDRLQNSHQKLVKRAYFDQVCEGLGPHLQSLKALISLLEEKDSPIVILFFPVTQSRANLLISGLLSTGFIVARSLGVDVVKQLFIDRNSKTIQEDSN